MKRLQKVASAGRRGKSAGAVIALAMTWDGARWPTRMLPVKARTFLKGSSRVTPSTKKVTELLTKDQVKEIRICWVSCLKGGNEVLSESFQTPTGMRIGFQAVKTLRFGDMLGVIYRKK